MSTDRQYGHIIIECDGDCDGTTFMLGVGDPFENVWNEAKEEGWTARKDGLTWRHYCPHCEPE